MLAVRQTWALCEKTITVVFFRHWLGTLTRAFLAPIILVFILGYSKNFFVPPSNFGIGSPTPVRSLSDAASASAGGRDILAIVNNGFTGGDIQTVIDDITAAFTTSSGKSVRVVGDTAELLDVCPSSLRGVTPCFAGVVFDSSPNEGPHGQWNYTIRADGSFGTNIYVDRTNNAAEIYVLPLQHAIDSAIASIASDTLQDDVEEFPYTARNPQERQENITRLYMNTLINILGLAYFIGIVGICYQLTGHMAYERELGMSQLIESMMPNRQRWVPQVVRLASLHISFDILYFPSWVIMGATVGALNYPHSNIGIPIGFFILAGLALASWSIAFASLFSKAQLSGITVTITSIVLAILIQVIPPPGTAGAVVLAVIFPPINFTLFIIYMAYWERLSEPAILSQGAPIPPPYTGRGMGPPWQFPGYVFFIICILQLIVYPVIGALIERALYGTGSKSRQLRYNTADSPEAVKVTSLSKHYPASWFSRRIGSLFSKNPPQTVRAVNDVSFTVYRGQIMVLLGANGSGKSTTLDTLAGIQEATGGSIEMDATGGIGLCPQKNVLWNELTVLEHVRIFNKLKAEKVDSKTVLKDLVASCDLTLKIDARSSTLSGGQKRKCQLAMMLTGGSSVCMLDEVSSGLDPLSRRKIWDIILAERGKRSMLMTTHFLDEADLLSDDITILSRGNLVAHGSSVELKHHLGGGYRVHIYNEDRRELPAKLEATQKRVYHDQVVYNLPDSAAAANFVVELERHGVSDYQVNGPTIEDVFLKLAEEVKGELDKSTGPSSEKDGSDESLSSTSRDRGLELLPGRPLSFFGQTWVLFRKRATVLKRNKWPYIIALLLPIIAAGLVTLFLGDLPPLSCDPREQVTISDRVSAQNFELEDGVIPVGPDTPVQYLREQFSTLGTQDTYVTQNSLSDFLDFFTTDYSRIRPGGVFVGDASSPTFSWLGGEINDGLASAVVSQNLLNVGLLQTPINAGYQSFDEPGAPTVGDTLQFILYFGLAMAAYPAFFALYTNAERLRNVRALHYSNGVRAGPLWIAYTAFDFIIVLVVSAVSVGIFVSASSIFYYPGYLFVIFALYGLSATLMAYIASLFTTSQLATFAIAAGGQVSYLLLYFLVYLLIITFRPAASIDNEVDIAHYTMALFFPSGNLLRALLLSLNQFSLLCHGETTLPSYPGDIQVYGGAILYLVLQCVIQLVVLIWYDSGYKPAFLARRSHKSTDVEETEDVDDEVFAEAARVDSCKDELRVKHATKAFRSFVAVQDVTFGVPHGQTFALLGPNGAGKSTTINLIRGDMRPSEAESDILIEDISIIDRRAAARQNLGVCPQFDAIDTMTAIEHLRFYARARGVADVEHNVEKVIHAVGLEPFKTRMAAKLSGGNKRKLSLGIALMGNPSVLILDEPSSGMDPASKRGE
jgi:ABC-type multidrug transport system ATPase subunit